jgi:hypothetical protein
MEPGKNSNQRDNALDLVFLMLCSIEYICSLSHRSSLQATTKGMNSSQARMVAELQGDGGEDDGEDSDDDGIHVSNQCYLLFGYFSTQIL